MAMDKENNKPLRDLGIRVLREAKIFYFAPSSDEEITLFSQSTSAGSGKTLASIEYMIAASNTEVNFLYVAPTRELVNQTYQGLVEKIDAGSLKNVNLIYKEPSGEQMSQSVAERALETIQESRVDTGVIVILTTVTFRHIVPMITKKGDWHIVLDESFNACDFEDFSLGDEKHKQASRDYFDQYFSIDNSGVVSVRRSPGTRETLKAIARNDRRAAGDIYSNAIQKIARSVLNHGTQVELANKGNNKYTFACWMKPQQFVWFREVIVLSALFEESLLCRLWSQQGVQFKEHEFFREAIKRDIHVDQSPYISIGHILHEGNSASKANLQRNFQTGEKQETRQGLRVIDRAIEIGARFLKGKKPLLQANLWTGFNPKGLSRKARMMMDEAGIRPIPFVSHGLNKFQDHTCIMAFGVTNPSPSQLSFLMKKGLEKDHIFRAFRLGNIYQALTRTCIRQWGNTKHVTFLVIGEDDALYLHELFQGSRWIGKVGDMPDLNELACKHHQKRGPKTNLKDNPTYQKLILKEKRLAEKIRRMIRKDQEPDPELLEEKRGTRKVIEEMKRENKEGSKQRKAA